MFKEDVEFGEFAERAFMRFLQKEGHQDVVQSEGEFSEYDVKTEICSYEIKCDRLSGETGNAFIEYSYKKEPSGLAKTLADYFVVIGSDKVARIATVANYKDFLRQNWPFLKKVSGEMEITA